MSKQAMKGERDWARADFMATGWAYEQYPGWGIFLASSYSPFSGKRGIPPILLAHLLGIMKWVRRKYPLSFRKGA
jgi:hypothetical protein